LTESFYIFDHPLLPTPYNFRFTVEKIAGGFAHQGFAVRLARKAEEVTEPGIVMLGDHDCFYGWAARRYGWGVHPGRLLRGIPPLRPGSPLAARLGKRGQHRALAEVGRQLRRRPGVVALAWHWHREAELFEALKIPVIFTGVYFWGEPGEHRDWPAFSRREDKALPMKFAADIDPAAVGQRCTNRRIDVAYVGAKDYKPEWQRAFAKDSRNRIVGTPPWIDEEERVDIYRNAKLVLGLNAEANITSGLVVERVYEALAYGAVLITDSQAVVEATDGIARYARDLDEAQAVARHYLAEEDERRDLRDRGFEFARQSGTYAHRAADFIALRDRLSLG
jgi:hypothetical protein